VPSLGDAGAASEVKDPARRAPTWPRALVVVAVLVLAFVISRSSSEEVTQEEAVAKATQLVDFVPEDTQVRFLRQGLDRHPFWVVSLSTPGRSLGIYADLAVARIDAETGEVVEFREQKDARRGPDEAP
jgi:hypothetical protein